VALELSPTQLAAANLETTAVAPRTLRKIREVPGRLRYDERRHVEITPASPGFVRRIDVAPGQHVAAGEPLVVISSPEVGDARADVLQRMATSELADRNLRRATATEETVAQLAEKVRQGAPLEALQGDTRAAALGPLGETLVAAYADFLIAERLQASVAPVANQGVLSGRLLTERQIAEARARTALWSAVDAALFGAETARLQALHAAQDAERRLRVSREHLAALLGRHAPTDLPADADDVALSEFTLVAPFSGTVEAVHLAPSERIASGQPALTFADASSLWVAADVREPEWAALATQPGEEIEVVVPAEPAAAPRTARVHYVGRQVSAETNAVPLVAILDNSDGGMRPGQYVRVRLPLGEPQTQLATPDAAIVVHERASFVYVQTAPGRFRKQPVTPGVSSQGWTAVLAGLSPGDVVVSRGAFALKSEELLDTLAE
jgi:cobalt-zinc-cadmium efflux system membrane fusion protein